MRDSLGRIFRHTTFGLLGLGLSALAANAAPLPPSGFDRPPFLVISWTTVTIAAQEIETSAVIHLGGATEITEKRAGEPVRIFRGKASAVDFLGLNQTLQDGQIGLARGGCGGPTADGPIEYEITWYGQTTRFNSFKVGATLEGCTDGLSSMVNSILKLVDAVRPAPETQQFPRLSSN